MSEADRQKDFACTVAGRGRDVPQLHTRVNENETQLESK